MTYKEFVNWCNQRTCDGLWSRDVAMFCISIMQIVNAESRRAKKRELFWQTNYASIEDKIIKPINELIEKRRGGKNDN